MTVAARTPLPPAPIGLTEPRRRRWGWAQCLALAGAPVLLWETWTIVAWLLDGPHAVTQFRTPGSTNWWVARIFEGIIIAIAIPTAVYVIRGVIRARTLTFDAMFCGAGLSILWANAGVNIIGPTFLYTSNFVNLNNTCGHMPFIVNPDCGRLPDPVLFNWNLEAFGLLACAIVAERPIKWLYRRRPNMSTLQLFGWLCLAGYVLDFSLEIPAISFGMWTYTAPAGISIPLGDYRYAMHNLIATPFFFALPIMIRFFKDDRGRTIVERGLDHLGPVRRKAVAFMALYTLFQLLTWGPATLPIMSYGPFQHPWPKWPEYIINDVCDAPGIEGTRYGPCPGSPGFRMPIRESLFHDDRP